MKITDANGKELQPGDAVAWNIGQSVEVFGLPFVGPPFPIRCSVQRLIEPGGTVLENGRDAPGKIVLQAEIEIPAGSGGSLTLTDIVKQAEAPSLSTSLDSNAKKGAQIQ